MYTLTKQNVGHHNLWVLKKDETVILTSISRTEAEIVLAILQGQQLTIEDRDAEIAVLKSRLSALTDPTIAQGSIEGLNPMAGRKYKEDGK